MGGIGSGCWERDEWAMKTAVRDCYALDVNLLARDGVLRPGTAGATFWKHENTGEVLASISFSTFLRDGGKRIFRVSYTLNDSEKIDIPIRLQTTCPNYGGLRFWFTCPLIVNGNPCNRRVGKLYLPPRARYFGCRHCHELVYRREPDPLEHAARFVEIQQKRMERIKNKHGW